MKHYHKRITKIVDELINYLFSMGATDTSVNIKDIENHYKISFESNYEKGMDEKIDKLIKYLNCPRQEEMEEYYWELTGDCDVNTELSLVGMMVDEVEVSFVEGKIQIVLHRYKSRT